MVSRYFITVAVLLLVSFSGSGKAREGHLPLSFSKIGTALGGGNIKNKIVRSIGGAFLVTTLVCGNITGCDYGSTRSVVDVLGEKKEGDNDLFVIVDGVWYQGYQGGSVGQLRADIADESGKITFLQRGLGFVGKSIVDHQHIGKELYIDNGDFRWYGIVSRVFTNGWYEIEIDNWVYTGEGDGKSPSSIPSAALARERNAAELGGFVFIEELFE